MSIFGENGWPVLNTASASSEAEPGTHKLHTSLNKSTTLV